MKSGKVTLNETIKFHGHLGPYLVLGVLAGEVALKKLRCKKYFGLEVKVWGAGEKPKSCLIDGLQLSTGATYGKGNIQKLDGRTIKIKFYNKLNHKKINLSFKSDLIQRLRQARTHHDSEILAKKLYSESWDKLFKLSIFNR